MKKTTLFLIILGLCKAVPNYGMQKFNSKVFDKTQKIKWDKIPIKKFPKAPSKITVNDNKKIFTSKKISPLSFKLIQTTQISDKHKNLQKKWLTWNTFKKGETSSIFSINRTYA